MSSGSFDNLLRVPWWRKPSIWWAARRSASQRRRAAETMRCVAVVIGRTNWTDLKTVDDTHLWECWENGLGRREIRFTPTHRAISHGERHPLWRMYLRPWETGMISTADLSACTTCRVRA